MAVEEPRFGAAAGGRGRAQAGEDADHRAVNRWQQTEAGCTLNFCFIITSSQDASGGRMDGGFLPHNSFSRTNNWRIEGSKR